MTAPTEQPAPGATLGHCERCTQPVRADQPHPDPLPGVGLYEHTDCPPGDVPVNDEMAETFALAYYDHDCGSDSFCCIRTGLAAVAPLIAAQVRAELAAAGRLLSEGDQPDGWDRAQQTLREVADRTGSYSARYWADYLVKDPDRRRPGSASAAPVDTEGEQG